MPVRGRGPRISKGQRRPASAGSSECKGCNLCSLVPAMLPSGMPPLKFEQCSQNLLVGRGDSPGVCIGAYIKTGYRPIAPGAKLRARSQAILREADPLLMQALASFHTNDDDKDSDTLLNITLSNGPD